jgi:hypothetical protein
MGFGPGIITLKINLLDHKVGDDTVKDTSLEVQGLAAGSSALFAGAKCTKVFLA